MKLSKAASLILIIGLAASAQAQQAAAPAQQNGQTAASATATPKVDPAEVKARAQEHLAYIAQYSLTLPEKERKPYNDLFFSVGIIMHKVDRGMLPAEELDAKIKDLEKFYEDDQKLSPQEAQTWGASIAPLAAPQRRQ